MGIRRSRGAPCTSRPMVGNRGGETSGLDSNGSPGDDRRAYDLLGSPGGDGMATDVMRGVYPILMMPFDEQDRIDYMAATGS